MTTGDRPESTLPTPRKPGDRALVRRAQEPRERVIARLADHFAHDALDVDEFERRITVAHTSNNPRTSRRCCPIWASSTGRRRP